MSLGCTLPLRWQEGVDQEEHAEETEKEQTVRYENQKCVQSWKPKYF